ncbi:hypothetical protein OF001_U420007 [Pseudomonas sp. OF001]|nr:hypothetical protein OF001_U420007 [Pseudomonas sp. OF001]
MEEPSDLFGARLRREKTIQAAHAPQQTQMARSSWMSKKIRYFNVRAGQLFAPLFFC